MGCRLELEVGNPIPFQFDNNNEPKGFQNGALEYSKSGE